MANKLNCNWILLENYTERYCGVYICNVLCINNSFTGLPLKIYNNIEPQVAITRDASPTKQCIFYLSQILTYMLNTYMFTYMYIAYNTYVIHILPILRMHDSSKGTHKRNLVH